jgi:hypothetical protein
MVFQFINSYFNSSIHYSIHQLIHETMKTFRLLKVALGAAVLLLGAMAVPQRAMAEGDVWNLVTNTGQRLSMKYVSYLLMSDDANTFSVVPTSGATINGVRSITFEKGVDTSVGSVQTGAATVGLYPNPVTSSLTLTGVAQGSTIQVLSLTGVTLRTAVAAEGQTVMDVRQLPAGTYLLRAGGATVKFIKK